MHVVHLVQRFHPATGGAETYVREIALEQSRRGHRVTVLTTMPPRSRSGATATPAAVPHEERIEAEGGRVDVVRFPTRHFRGDYLFPPWLPMRGADAWLARADADLLHAHSYRFDTMEVAARARRARGTTFVASALGFYPPENALVALSRRVYDRGAGGRALCAADRCVALTSDEVQYHVALGVPAERVEVVPPGILPRALEPGDGEGFRKAHGLEGEVVTFLARLGHDKGVTDLVQAMPRVLRSRPDAVLAVCGPDAGARAAAERAARRLGVAKRVRFLGRVPETRDAYAAADVFVHPSHYESFGLVIVEAMAQRRAVVTTTAGGMPEAAGGAAELVPPGDPRALGDAIAALLADPAHRARMGEAGHAHARTLLWPRMVEKLEGCYARAAASR